MDKSPCDPGVSKSDVGVGCWEDRPPNVESIGCDSSKLLLASKVLGDEDKVGSLV